MKGRGRSREETRERKGKTWMDKAGVRTRIEEVKEKHDGGGDEDEIDTADDWRGGRSSMAQSAHYCTPIHASNSQRPGGRLSAPLHREGTPHT